MAENENDDSSEMSVFDKFISRFENDSTQGNDADSEDNSGSFLSKIVDQINDAFESLHTMPPLDLGSTDTENTDSSFLSKIVDQIKDAFENLHTLSPLSLGQSGNDSSNSEDDSGSDDNSGQSSNYTFPAMDLGGMKDLMDASFKMQQMQTDMVKEQLERSKSSLSKLTEKLFANDKERVKLPGHEDIAEVKRKLDYMLVKIDETYNFYHKRRESAGFFAGFFTLMTTLLGASIAVLLGLNISGIVNDGGLTDWILQSLALVMSALITIMNELKRFYDTNELAVKFADTMAKLRQLKGTIEYLKLGGDYVTLEEANAIKLEYDRIVEDADNFFVAVRSDFQSTNFSKGMK